jgi:cytochrome c-L
MGPSLVGDKFTYPQSATDVGMFAVIYGGAGGAMQPFAKREITQDEILKVIAYVRSLHK